MTVNTLYKKARATPKVLGAILLTQAQQYVTRAILVDKGYKLLKRDKNKSYKEPWLMVSSLPESVLISGQVRSNNLVGFSLKSCNTNTSGAVNQKNLV